MIRLGLDMRIHDKRNDDDNDDNDRVMANKTKV